MRIALLLTVCAVFATACGLTQGGTADVISGRVTEIVETGDRTPIGSAMPQPFQRVRIQLEESLYRGEVVEVQWGGRRALDPNGFLRVGDRVLLSVTRDGNNRTYAILEIVRLPALVPVAAILVLALLVVARLKGLAALAGLASSVAVFLLAVVPALRGGSDPLVATIFGCLGVIIVSVFVVHGFNRKSLAALCGTMAGLGIVTAIGAFALATARMTGLGSEEQVFLAVGTDGRIDMARLALAAVMVGSLGAIVDMAVGQASATSELAAVDEHLRGRALYTSALNVGRDHIGSLVNTLALAYFGGALPLILLVSLGYQPFSISLNSEQIVESLIAIMAASLGLVLCVPITTAIAVMFAGSAAPRAEE